MSKESCYEEVEKILSKESAMLSMRKNILVILVGSSVLALSTLRAQDAKFAADSSQHNRAFTEASAEAERLGKTEAESFTKLSSAKWLHRAWVILSANVPKISDRRLSLLPTSMHRPPAQLACAASALRWFLFSRPMVTWNRCWLQTTSQLQNVSAINCAICSFPLLPAQVGRWNCRLI